MVELLEDVGDGVANSGVYKLSNGGATRFPRRAGRTETLADDFTCDFRQPPAIPSSFLLDTNHTNMGDHLPCESAPSSCYSLSH